MAGQPSDPQLSESELRRMLLERREQDRERRLQAFLEREEILPLHYEAAEEADPDPLSAPRVRPHKLHLQGTRPANKTVDRLLLGVEALAVLGLIVVFIAGLNLFNRLNDQVSSYFAEQLLPTAIVVPNPVVLPSGHTAPLEGQEPQPNQEEIPEDLQVLHQTYTASLVAPPPSPEQAQSIQIDALNLAAPIVQGDDWEHLKLGVGQHIGSADPGQLGNLVLSGHNDIYGQVFRYLDRLEIGDEIIVHTENQSHTYRVSASFTVSPTQVDVMFPTEDARLTLISCYPFLIDNQRIIIQAELAN